MTVNYPKNWNELTGKQLLSVLKIIHQPISTEAKKLLLLKTILSVKMKSLRRMEIETVARCMYVLDPFIKGDVSLTKNLLPWLRLHLIWYQLPFKVYGPADGFKNMSFLEFVFADTYYSQQFGKKPKPDALDKMLAVLYRRKRDKDLPGSLTYKGDIRQNFNEHLISDHSKYFTNLDPVKKLAVRTWFSGCRQQLEKMYPYVFSGDNQKKAASSGWTQVLISLAGEKFGTIDQTGTENLHTVLMHMNEVIKENEELKDKYGK
ncbi:hypothetical protein [Xanthocytophaga agilis]|uniref:Uncharacterized protein n=1 Tax=Xanthocytophaga agilis TaxID=3048010 RepID=A0AAE3R2K8_9BACT|nr:hypothetical protein [Xanthocytophaga agilis]MDJ1500457.1 hypothetical protein [Xanthocytophaga agilis]